MADLLILVDQDPPVLVALEAKVYDRPTMAALEAQMLRQRTIVLDYLAPVLGVPDGAVFHAALVPSQLSDAPDYTGFAYHVLTWQRLYVRFAEGRD